MKLTKVIALIVITGAIVAHFSKNEDGNISSKKETSNPAFIYVNGDSATLTDPVLANDAKLLLLAQLKALNTKRKFAKAQLQVISTSYARPVWVGKISDLKTQRAEKLVDQIEANSQNCNKLAESFMAVNSAIKQLEQQGYNQIHVMFFSSLISTGSPCSNVKQIALPQLPVAVNYRKLFTSSDALASLHFYWVNPHQMKFYQTELADVNSWSNSSDIKFGMFSMKDTEFQLRNGLPGVK